MLTIVLSDGPQGTVRGDLIGRGYEHPVVETGFVQFGREDFVLRSLRHTAEIFIPGAQVSVMDMRCGAEAA